VDDAADAQIAQIRQLYGDIHLLAIRRYFVVCRHLLSGAGPVRRRLVAASVGAGLALGCAVGGPL